MNMVISLFFFPRSFYLRESVWYPTGREREKVHGWAGSGHTPYHLWPFEDC